MSAAIAGSTLAGRNSLATRVAIPNERAATGAQVAGRVCDDGAVWSAVEVGCEVGAEHSVVTP
jgi:hypothetical protein